MATEEGVSAAAMASVAVTESAVVALRLVLSRVQQAVAWSGQALELVRVVAVSKTKPVAVIRGVYDACDHYFGENYVQELLGKAPQIADRLNRVVADLGRNRLRSWSKSNQWQRIKIWSRSLRMCRISKACEIKLPESCVFWFDDNWDA